MDGFVALLGQRGLLDVELREKLLDPNLTQGIRVQYFLLKLHKSKMYEKFLRAMKESSHELRELAGKIESTANDMSLPLGVCEKDSSSVAERLSVPQQVEEKLDGALVLVNSHLMRGSEYLVPTHESNLTEGPHTDRVRCTEFTSVNHPLCLPKEDSAGCSWLLSILSRCCGAQCKQVKPNMPVVVTDDDYECYQIFVDREFQAIGNYLYHIFGHGPSPNHTHPTMKLASGVLKSNERGEIYNHLLKTYLADVSVAENMVVNAIRSDQQKIPFEYKVIAADAGLTKLSGTSTPLSMLYDLLNTLNMHGGENFEILATILHSHIASIHAHAGNIAQAKYHTTAALQLCFNIRDPAVFNVLWTHGWLIFLEHAGKETPIPDSAIRELDQVYSQCMSLLRVLPTWFSDCQKHFGLGKADIHLRIAKDKILRGATAEEPQVYQLLQRAKDTMNAVDPNSIFEDNNKVRVAFYNQLWFTLYHLQGNGEKAKLYLQPSVDNWIKSNTPTGFRLAKEVAEMAGDPALLKHVSEAAALHTANLTTAE